MKLHQTPLIITVAGVGAELTKKHTPFVPLTPDEIIAEAEAVARLGASIFHLHVRDTKGRPTCDPRVIRKVTQGIRRRTNLILQVSTGGAIGDTEVDRLGTLIKGLEMGSLTMGSINFGDEVFLNPAPLILKLYAKMKRLGIRPELEIFDVAMLEFALYLIKQGQMEPAPHFDFVMGGRGFLPATPENLDFLLAKLPRLATYSVAGIGSAEFSLAEMALSRGGHVRVGLEDNIFLSRGVLARGNAELVQGLLGIAARHGRRIASVEEARKILKV